MNPTVKTPPQARQDSVPEIPPAKEQDLIEKWTHIGIRVSLWTLLIFLVFAIMFGKSFTRTSGLQSVEAMDNAQLAYNISEGKGFVTNVIRPLSLAFKGMENVQSQPDAVNPPLYPFVLSIAFRLKGAYDQTVVLTSALFFFLLMPLVYLVAKRLFDARVGNWALLFCLLNAPLLSHSVRGVAVPLVAFLVTLLALTLAYAGTSRAEAASRESDKTNGISPVLAAVIGVLLGLGALAQYSIGLLVLPVGIYLAQVSRSRRFVVLGAFLACFVIVIAPWLYRNYRAFGSPFFCLRNYEFLMGTTAYPGEVLYRRLEADLMTPFQFLTQWRGAPMGVMRKYALTVAGYYQQLPSLFNVLLMGFFLVSLFYPFQHLRVRRLRVALIWMVVMLVVVVPFFDARGSGVVALLPLVPLAMVFAAAGFVRILDEWLKEPLRRLTACAVTCALIALPLLTVLVLQKAPPDNPSATTLEILQGHIEKNAIVVTNTPWEVAWVSRRKAIWFPETPQALEDIDQLIRPSKVDYIYL
ncbi:MAG: glycosyltransferase family 39 protein, partial [Abditibacteriales bacterium]|nr:glycosyltransferase family 39 protein [Abditibacteriales bacterium]MDW8366101.1 glycosyltransferase family 39 protein [Abditibacteriales bacterium]